jgi:anti-sigma28 factor (negative regulator of flagellin synthesis)
MSMRINSQTDANIIGNAQSAGAKTANQGSTTAHMPNSLAGTDDVSLSSASGLASLAKTLTPANRQMKLAALSAQVGSGQYRADGFQVSRSLVQEHLNN